MSDAHNTLDTQTVVLYFIVTIDQIRPFVADVAKDIVKDVAKMARRFYRKAQRRAHTHSGARAKEQS